MGIKFLGKVNTSSFQNNPNYSATWVIHIPLVASNEVDMGMLDSLNLPVHPSLEKHIINAIIFFCLLIVLFVNQFFNLQGI
jgi:hypothetical protein